MNLHFLRLPVSMILACVFLLIVSCSKDSDLLSDYISGEQISDIINIEVYGLNSQTLLINPIEYGIEGAITQVSNPEFGEVVINEDNTLTYTPTSNQIETDEFDYVSEETTDQESSSNYGSVKVILSNDNVDYWKRKFDYQYTSGGDRAKMFELSRSGNKFQEYYYMFYYFDGLLSIWQATGDNKYLDDMLEVVNNTIEDAKPVNFNTSYLGWPSDSSYDQDYPKNGVALWESYYWKGVTTLLRIMYKSPQLMTVQKYKTEFDEILNFTEKNIWEKWQTKGSNYIYRTHTHMASHWARMGMELYLITGDSKYKSVFDNISFGEMPNTTSNLRNRIYENPKVQGAYVWDMPFNVPLGSKVQDTSHASDIIGFWILAYENEMYWNIADIEALSLTLDKIIFPGEISQRAYTNVDGSGGFDAPGRLRDWLKLGRFNRDLENKLINKYQSYLQNANRYSILNLGIFALNEKILTDGKPIYPEN